MVLFLVITVDVLCFDNKRVNRGMNMNMDGQSIAVLELLSRLKSPLTIKKLKSINKSHKMKILLLVVKMVVRGKV